MVIGWILQRWYRAKMAEPPERRCWPRREKPFRVLVVSLEDALDDPFPAWVRDYSQGGVCLSVPGRRLAEGSLLGLAPAQAGNAGLGWAEVKVKNCRKQDDGILVGCQFVHRMPWDALLPESLEVSAPPRHLAHLICQVRWRGSSRCVFATARAFSGDSIELIAAEPVHERGILQIDLTTDDASIAFSCQVQPNRTARLADGRWLIAGTCLC